VKKAHIGVIPGMKEYLAEFTSKGSMGPTGYLADLGLIPLSDADYKKVRTAGTQLNTISLN
jgi:hypothetical protein